MTTVTRPFCADCGREYDGDPDLGYSSIGPCCTNLPSPWTRDEDGRFTRSTGRTGVSSDYFPDDDEDDEPLRPTCSSCGSHEFRVYVTTYSSYYVGDTSHNGSATLWVDASRATRDDRETSVECSSCGYGFSDWEYC